jgi:chloramphenicol 3-O-phosphotransferase
LNKKLIIINGTMGVGKTSIASDLQKRLNNSVWLDGDWCWMMNPWNFSDENKTMVIENITYLLKNFLRNSSFENIIFSWVISDESIFSTLLDRLNDFPLDLFKITLICSEEKLKERFTKDNRGLLVYLDSAARLKKYDSMDTYKIDTTDLTIEEITTTILNYLTTAQKIYFKSANSGSALA